MHKKIINSLRTYILTIIIFSISLDSQAKLFVENDFKLPSIAISKNISSILRIICFEADLYVHASNLKGSDMELLKENACIEDGVVEYNFIQSENIGDSTGIIRKLKYDNKNIVLYSGKGSSPTILVKELKNHDE